MSGSAYYLKYDEIVGAIGSRAADALVAARGGTRFYVCDTGSARLELANEIGMEAARAFIEYMSTGVGGIYIEIPRRKEKTENIELRKLAADRSQTEEGIAKRLGIHMRTVRRMRARLRKEGLWQGAT